MESCLKSKSAPKLKRKYLERNRRNNMKKLYNQIYSMLPTHASTSSKKNMTVPDQINAAVNYIESLKMKLEKKKKHLKELKMGPKRAQSCNANKWPGPSTKSPPQIEFHEMGPNMVVVLITGLDNIATFNNIIRLCHEEGVEVVSTQFQLNGNSTLEIYHATKVHINRSSSTMEFRATTLCDNMKKLIYGPSCNNDMESNLHLWDDIVDDMESNLHLWDDIVDDMESNLHLWDDIVDDMESNLHLWDDIVESEQSEFYALELMPTPSQIPNMPNNYMQNVYEIPSFF